jgi:hypothetical protein
MIATSLSDPTCRADSLDVKHWPIAAATVHAMAYENHWLPGFNFNVEEWDAKGLHYESLAICRRLPLAHAVFAAAIAEKPAAGS